MRPFLASLTLAATVLLGPAVASAQVHWDAGVSVGIAKRFLADKAGGDAMFGPVLDVQGHVAVIPLLRVGAYVHGELSDTESIAPPRNLFAGGLHVRVLSPWPHGAWRAWLGLGFGYAAAYAPSYVQRIAPLPDPVRPPGPYDAKVEGSGGGSFDVPLGVGLAWRPRKPWQLFAELGSRFGFAFSGTLYGEGGGRPAYEPTLGPLAIAPEGKDVFALFLTIGAAVDM
jgi:hypothetical protein